MHVASHVQNISLKFAEEIRSYFKCPDDSIILPLIMAKAREIRTNVL